ncbi:HAD family phosphatase [Rhodocytophaga rosea]|uniref:HAD family phosphatase n=2 Tax=Rhodocytophaga rosea TaxID=2704465 RepID=A0A6C0GVB3_9BACT|nr:HAD family phosphatase [Rhodocytophaga rosea]
MSQITIDTVIFDFGGVLIDWNPRYLYRKMFDKEHEMEWFLSTVCTNDWNLAQDKGRPFAEAVTLLQAQFPAYKDQVVAFYERWPEMLAGEIPGSIAVLDELLARNYAVYGLTNWSHETFPVAQERFEFLNRLHGIVVSGREKMGKPDKEIFHLLLNRFGLISRQCVFIDDNAANIQTAQELGFHTIHFTSANEMRKELEQYNLL